MKIENKILSKDYSFISGEVYLITGVSGEQVPHIYCMSGEFVSLVNGRKFSDNSVVNTKEFGKTFSVYTIQPVKASLIIE